MHEHEFAEFADAYPEFRRVITPRAKAAFTKARRTVALAHLHRALAQHKRSDQWHKQIVPSLTRWLEEARWTQTLPEPASTLSAADQAQRWKSLSPQAQLRRIK